MPQYFYAYHNNKNISAFNPSVGYGVSSETKRNRVKVGDFVFVIQKLNERGPFELCGLYKVTGHYNENSGDYRYRLRLANTQMNAEPIPIDEGALSQELPQLSSYQNWSNFKRHFCKQGASLRQPLSSEVVSILSEMMHHSATAEYQTSTELSDIEAAFQDQVGKSKELTSAERRLRLSSARKKPETRSVMVRTYVRNPDVVAEALHIADGFCGNCKRKAPFLRRSDGSAYLEVHHRVPLAEGGEDTLENAIALCPNCHRKEHYGA